MMIQRLHTAGASVRSTAPCFSRSSFTNMPFTAAPTSCSSPWTYAHVRSRLVGGSRAQVVGVCNVSKQTEVGGYTPSDYITYSEDKEMWCTHEAGITIDAPIETVFGYWNDWSKLLEYFDLIGEIGLDPESPDLALLTCYYRWASLPVMELAFVLAKTEVQDNKYITFKSEWGMPCSGYVAVGEGEDGCTEVEFVFTHALPDLMIQLGVGSFGIGNALKPAWEEILQELKKLAEAARPDNWESELKAAAAERGKELAVRKEELAQQLAAATEEAKHQEQALQQDMELQPSGGGQPAEPAAAPTSSSSSSSPPKAPGSTSTSSSSGKRSSSSRPSTSSRKASSRGASESSSSGSPEPPPASTPVPLKRRGRSTRSAAPSEEELAAAAAEPGGSKPGKAAGGRRSTTSSTSAAAAGAGELPGGDAGEGGSRPGPKRRTSRKTTAS